MVMKPEHWPTLIASAGLILLWTLETWLPAALGRRRRLRHAAGNLTLALLNALALALLAGPLLILTAERAAESGFGLLRLLSLPPLASAALAVLMLDGWMYLWHRANHRFAFLWRFHRVHHSDAEMDATTALRFHPGEILISASLRLALIPLLGVTLPQLLLYDALLMPVILFHHSNVRFPERWDRLMRALLASPAMHRVHHSRARAEADSNYASVLSCWDRLGRSLRLREGGQPVNFGLDEFGGEDRESAAGMLLMPFAPAGGQSEIPAPSARRNSTAPRASGSRH
jgi:sterol desaturase/sphingolipid hydroxylase (fatty acid hydroxylase superfamily)